MDGTSQSNTSVSSVYTTLRLVRLKSVLTSKLRQPMPSLKRPCKTLTMRLQSQTMMKSPYSELSLSQRMKISEQAEMLCQEIMAHTHRDELIQLIQEQLADDK